MYAIWRQYIALTSGEYVQVLSFSATQEHFRWKYVVLEEILRCFTLLTHLLSQKAVLVSIVP